MTTRSRLKRARILIGRPATRGQLLTVAAIIVATSFAFGKYLDSRRATADQRAERQREGVCAVFDTIPAGHFPAIDAARADFRCGPPKPPLLQPRVTVTVGPHTRVVRVPGATFLQPSPDPTVTRPPSAAPTIVITATTKPRPSSRPPRKPSPTPKPSSCNVNHLLRCLPTPTILTGPALPH